MTEFKILRDIELEAKTPEEVESYFAEARKRCEEVPILSLLPADGDFVSRDTLIAQAIEKGIAADESQAKRAALLAVAEGYLVQCSHATPGRVGYRRHPHCCTAQQDWLAGK